MYVYIKLEPGLWTVGFYKSDGNWEPESDHGVREEAVQRVHYLNGGDTSFFISNIPHQLPRNIYIEVEK